MRVDKYIWAVRLFKTRSQASKACSGERVLINGEFAKASKLLKDNDVISIKSTPIWRTFIVIDYPKSRVGPKLVNEYVKETTSISELEKLINVLIYLLPKLYLVNVFKNDLELHVQFFEQDT